MKPDIENGGGFGWAAAVFGVYAFPLLFASPYQLLAVRDSPYHWRHILSAPAARRLYLIHWTVTAGLFSWIARKVRFNVLLPLAPATIALAIVVTVAIVRLLGINFHWDLWH